MILKWVIKTLSIRNQEFSRSLNLKEIQLWMNSEEVDNLKRLIIKIIPDKNT